MHQHFHFRSVLFLAMLWIGLASDSPVNSPVAAQEIVQRVPGRAVLQEQDSSPEAKSESVPQDQKRRDTDQWSNEMNNFIQQDKAQLHRDVVFTGSSSVRMWKLQESFGDKFQWINRGFGGSIINDNIVFMDKTIFPYSPKVVLLYAGDNDIGIEMSVEDVVADYKRFCEKMHAELPDAQLIYISIKPSLARWAMWPKMDEANKKIAALCRESEWQNFGDIAPVMLGDDGKPKPEFFVQDGLHMTTDGYKAWTSVLGPMIDKALQQK